MASTGPAPSNVASPMEAGRKPGTVDHHVLEWNVQKFEVGSGNDKKPILRFVGESARPHSLVQSPKRSLRIDEGPSLDTCSWKDPERGADGYHGAIGYVTASSYGGGRGFDTRGDSGESWGPHRRGEDHPSGVYFAAEPEL
jgi:hypothetical protein